MAWKYIMVTNKIGDLKVVFPLIFPDKLVHADLYRQVRTIMPGWQHEGVRATSAGKIERVAVAGIGGDSETLGVRYVVGDGDLIRDYHYQHGIVP